MRRHRAGEIALRPVLESQGRHLPGERGRQRLNLEVLPAVDISGRPADEERLDRTTGGAGDGAGQHDTHGEPHVGPVRSHPQPAAQLVDHGHRAAGVVEPQHGAVAGLEEQPFARRPAVGRHPRPFLEQEARGGIGFRDPPRRGTRAGVVEALDEIRGRHGSLDRGRPAEDDRDQGPPWQNWRHGVSRVGRATRARGREHGGER